MRTYIWSNKERTIVASERKHRWVVKKRLTKNSRLTFYDCKEYFMIVLATSKRIEIQTYRVASFFDEGHQRFETDFINLEVLADDEHIKVGETYRDGEYQFRLKQINGLFTQKLPEIYKQEEWTGQLRHSELRYIKLENNYWPGNLAHVYNHRHKIEFLQKIQANKFANQIIWNDRAVDMRRVTNNLLKESKSFFRRSEHSFDDYMLKNEIEKRGGKLIPGIEKILNYRDIALLPNIVGIVKLQNYLLKQTDGFGMYRDYISTLRELKLPLNKSNVLPKNLREFHDKAVEELNATKREIVRTEFEERAQEMKQLETTIGPYSFIIPKTADDLVHEGNALHHCVGGIRYINEHADKKTTIVFVRPKETPDKPKYTVEVKHGRIIQIQGMYNQASIPDELSTAVEKWVAKANRLKVAN